MNVSDETLMAYLDNELPHEERARIDAAIASDPELKARLDQQARLHRILNAAFDPIVKQPVPEHLRAAAMTTPASLRWRIGDTLSRLALPKAGRELAFVAASLLIGIEIGWAITTYAGRSSPNDGVGQVLSAQSDLATALTGKLASDQPQTGARVGVTFRAKDGGLCRTFETGEQQNRAGIACHGAEGWTINTMTLAPQRSAASYEQAGSGMPSAIRNAVADMIDGQPFDASQERRARDEGWNLQR